MGLENVNKVSESAYIDISNLSKLRTILSNMRDVHSFALDPEEQAKLASFNDFIYEMTLKINKKFECIEDNNGLVGDLINCYENSLQGNGYLSGYNYTFDNSASVSCEEMKTSGSASLSYDNMKGKEIIVDLLESIRQEKQLTVDYDGSEMVVTNIHIDTELRRAKIDCEEK